MTFTRSTVTTQMGGMPCIRGLRISVATIVAMVADGMTAAEMVAAYPDLEREDVAEGYVRDLVACKLIGRWESRAASRPRQEQAYQTRARGISP
jgi:hypothetical protein